MRGNIKVLTYHEAIDFLLPRHYSGRKPVISIAFGWYIDRRLQAVCTFGKPASPSLCKGIMGGEYQSNVYELNRLCREDDLDEPLSQFVGACLRRLSYEDWIIVSYADSGMNHNGYIYQACNFLYTGMTKKRTDKFTEGNKHSRHYSNENQNGKRKVRTAKHRYIYFCTRNKRLRKEWESKLVYEIQPFPKNENKNYILGTFMEVEVVNSERKEEM
jgi:hypothetical protein